MKHDRPKLYALIWGKLSTESVDEIKRHEDYVEFATEKDPLALWLAIQETHQVATSSKVAAVVKKASRDAYLRCKQGAFESIIAYKERFDASHEAYKANDNPKMKPEDVAMDFMNGLDDARYADFKVEIINDIAKGSVEQPKDKTVIYLLASRRLTTKKVGGGSLGASFATADSAVPKRQQHNNKPKGHTGGKSIAAVGAKPAAAAAGEQQVAQQKKRGARGRDICFNYARDCPDAEEEVEEAVEGKRSNATWAAFASVLSSLEPHEVCLDGCSEVSVLHPRFLSDIRDTEGQGFAGLSGGSKMIKQIGYLDGFFDCLVCNECTANILSQADVEDMYDVTYEQGVSYTVHLPGRDLIF
jgi:hypothetical protein